MTAVVVMEMISVTAILSSVIEVAAIRDRWEIEGVGGYTPGGILPIFVDELLWVAPLSLWLTASKPAID